VGQIFATIEQVFDVDAVVIESVFGILVGAKQEMGGQLSELESRQAGAVYVLETVDFVGIDKLLEVGPGSAGTRHQSGSGNQRQESARAE